MAKKTAAGTIESGLLGEIITWEVSGVNAPHRGIVSSLKACELDPSVAPPLSARSAFIRAASALGGDRLVRKVDESATEIRYQFTAETNDGSRLNYEMETILTLNKETGEIQCDDEEVLEKITSAFCQTIGMRTSTDVAAIVLRLFVDRRKADLDLIPLRGQGGVYFVRAERLNFVDQVQTFLESLGCSMNRFPVAAGKGQGEKSVAEAVASKMNSLIGELADAVDGFGEDTSPKKLQTAGDNIKTLRFKIDSYSAYLQDAREKLQRTLDGTSEKLRANVATIMADEKFMEV